MQLHPRRWALRSRSLVLRQLLFAAPRLGRLVVSRVGAGLAVDRVDQALKQGHHKSRRLALVVVARVAPVVVQVLPGWRAGRGVGWLVKKGGDVQGGVVARGAGRQLPLSLLATPCTGTAVSPPNTDAHAQKQSTRTRTHTRMRTSITYTPPGRTAFHRCSSETIRCWGMWLPSSTIMSKPPARQKGERPGLLEGLPSSARAPACKAAGRQHAGPWASGRRHVC